MAYKNVKILKQLKHFGTNQNANHASKPYILCLWNNL